MGNLDNIKQELDNKMTAIADGIRELSSDQQEMSLDDMIAGTQAANSEIADQEELLAQAAEALMGKVGSYNTGLVDGYNEALADRTDFEVKENGTYEPPEGSSGFKKVIANVKAKPVEEKQIIFIDYDGTVLYSYTPEEVLALTELPPHESTDPLLVFDGWNWTLEELKDEINLIGLDFMQNHKMAVGAMYQTLDDATYVFIKLLDDYTGVESWNTITVGFAPQTNTSVITVDWGDGSVPDTYTGSAKRTKLLSHTYNNKGEYCIRVSGDTYSFGSSNTNYNLINQYPSESCSLANSIVKKVYVGKIYKFEGSPFARLMSMDSVVISNNVSVFDTDDKMFGYSIFDSIVIPKSFNGTIPKNFIQDALVKNISLPKNNFKLAESAFSNKFLQRVHIPSTFGGASSSGVNTGVIGNMLIESYPVTCEAPMGFLSHCYNLKNVLLKNITSLKKNLFLNGYSLTKLKIPGTVTAIEASVFYYCQRLTELDFTECETVPTLANTDAFYAVPSTCKILVRANLVEEWKAATNWSTFANQIVAVEV